MQQFNYIHFIDLPGNEKLRALDLSQVDVDKEIRKIEEYIRNVSASIEFLKKYDTAKGIQELKEGPVTLQFEELEKRRAEIDFEKFHEELTDLQEKQTSILQQKKTIQDHLIELKPWTSLHIPLHTLSSFQKFHITMGTISKRLTPNLEKKLANLKYTVVLTVMEEELDAYMIVISHKDERREVNAILHDNGFATVQLSGYSKEPEEEIARLEETVKILQEEEKIVEEKLQALSIRMDDLELLFDYYMMLKNRIKASEKLLHTDWFTILEGYIPAKMEKKFEKLLHKTLGNDYYLKLEKAEEEDPDVPVLLENNRFFRPFESVTEMYAVPRYNEIDPTPWFTLFYALFFGIMVGDAGYGIVLLIASLVVLRFFNLKKSQRSFIRFFYYLSFSMILWGLIFGSFFGGVIPLPALIDATEEYNLLLTLSIAMGGFHIFFALGIKGYMHLKKGKILEAVYDVLFWYMAVGGGIVYLLSFILPLSTSIEKTGLTIMIIGMVGILLTGGRENKTIGGKLAGGLYSLYGITGYVGDFVSYSRLMALALSSAFIAFAINLMVSMLFELGIIGIIVGIIVFIVGQGFNLFLSMLSGYVHTLRLTYVEFFGKFYEGGGQRFETLRGESKYIEVK